MVREPRGRPRLRVRNRFLPGFLGLSEPGCERPELHGRVCMVQMHGSGGPDKGKVFVN